MRTRDILLLFGAYDLNDLWQAGSLPGSPSEIFIHPDWNPFNRRYDADIAAIIMDDEVPYTKFIRPICLSTLEVNSEKGFVAGWGQSADTSKNHENIPQHIKISIHNNEFCFLESNEFVAIASRRTVCAGDRDMRGPCRGDSGSGLFVQQGSSYYLKGIVSASLIKDGQCDVTNFALYTNVEKFLDWIKNPTEDLTITQVTTTRSTTQQAFENVWPSVFPQQTNPTQVKPTYGTSSSVPKSSCGIMNQAHSLIQGGAPSTREAFPWAVVIFVKQQLGNFIYISTGTLISNRHIITTGLSVAYLDPTSEKYIARSPNEFRMHFGISNLVQTSVAGSFYVDGAAQVVLHPNIKHGFPRIANVGILVLKNVIQFSAVVYPVCLPTDTVDNDEINGRNAVAVGYGQDETGADSKIKNFATVKIRSQNECQLFWADSLRRGGSSKFFCAGGDGRKSACYRDQPLYIKNDGIWFLRGLISIASNLPNNTCDLNKPVLYEDVGQYHNWITKQFL